MNNYTPINVKKIEEKFVKEQKKGINLDTILLLIGTLLAVALIFMLFILIQKKMQSSQEASVIPTIGSRPKPTLVKENVVSTPSAVPSIEVTKVLSITPSSTVSATPQATASATPTSTPSALLTSPTASPSATKTP
ncbi:MAG: hypothetical protein HYW86_01220 [Candidatus Roizmanbacteria bacterium]|nr:MAG: hypothetical protein HYW86_01220 [Candidatus Roizmanbacteria bacterium]